MRRCSVMSQSHRIKGRAVDEAFQEWGAPVDADVGPVKALCGQEPPWKTEGEEWNEIDSVT